METQCVPDTVTHLQRSRRAQSSQSETQTQASLTPYTHTCDSHCTHTVWCVRDVVCSDLYILILLNILDCVPVKSVSHPVAIITFTLTVVLDCSVCVCVCVCSYRRWCSHTHSTEQICESAAGWSVSVCVYLCVFSSLDQLSIITTCVTGKQVAVCLFKQK